MKNFSLSAAAMAVAGSLALAPTFAQANTLQFLNVDTLGGSNTFINVDKLSTNILSNNGNYTTFVDVGADQTLSNGDTFTESFELTSVSSIPLSGVNPNGLRLSGDYRIDVSLSGIIQGVLGTGITVNPDNSVTGADTTTFSVAFDNSSFIMKLYDAINNIFIADLTLVSGGAGNIQLVAGQFISPVTLNATLDCTPLCDPYLKSGTGQSLDGESILTVTTGSTRFIGFDGTTYDEDGSTLFVNFFDNGEATTFPVPEPSILSIVGLGLLGLGVSRRRWMKNTAA